MTDVPRVDEERRRAFERDRVHGAVDLASYLPAPAAPEHLATLEELVAIDLEFAWREGDGASRLAEHVERFPALAAPEVRARLEREDAYLRERHADALRPARPASSPRTKEGDALGRYRLLEVLGTGAFATVYRAHDPALDREVALKVLRREFDDHRGVRARLEREAKSAARMHHPGIVPIHEVGDVGGRPFLVSELVEGGSLEERLRSSPPAVEEAVELVAHVADALHYAHQLGIVHRDVKPANVLLDLDGRPKLADFGLAAAVERDAELTHDGELLGTPAYMAPEQVERPDAADSRSDVYALGVVLFRALAGRLPHQGGWTAILREKRRGESPRLRTVRPDLPRDLDVICATAMASDPGRRYESAAGLAADLRRWLAREPIQARPAGVLEQAWLFARRRPEVAATAAVGAALVVAVGAVGLGAVLDERDRLRVERDVAQANLYRSLIGEARAKLELRGSGWWWDGVDKVATASRLETEARDPKELRELAIEFLGAEDPCFRLRHELAAHAGVVHAVALDASGERVASGGEGGRFAVHVVATGEPSAQVELGAPVRGVGFHAGGAVGASVDGELATLVGTGPPRRASLGLEVAALACRPTHPFAVVGCGDGRALVLDGRTLEANAEFGRGAAVVDVALSPSGELVGLARADQSLEFWERETRTLLGATRTIDEIGSIEFLHERVLLVNEPAAFGARLYRLDDLDERRPRDVRTESHTRDLACASGWTIVSEHNGTIQAFDSSLEARAVGRSEFQSARCVAVDERALVVAAGHDGGVLRVWSLTRPPNRWYVQDSHVVSFTRSGEVRQDGRRVRLLDGGLTEARSSVQAAANRIAAHPSGFVLGARDGRLTRYDGAWQPLGSAPGDGDPVEHLVVDARRGTVAAAGREGPVRILGEDLAVLAEVRAPGGEVRALGFLPDGRLWVQGARAARLVSVGGATLAELPGLRASCGLAVDHVLVVGRDTGELETWSEGEDGWRRTRSEPAFGTGVVSLAHGSGARRLVAESRDGELCVWDFEREAAAQRISERGERHGSAGLAVDADARWLVQHGTSLVWDLERGQPFLWLETHNAGSAVFDDGDLLGVTHKGGVIRIDVAGLAAGQAEVPERERAWPLRVRRWEEVVGGGHSSKVWGRAESADGTWSATCAHDGSVKLWRERERSELVWTRDEGRGEIAWAVAFDAAGELLASTSSDVSVWDVATGERLARLDGHERLVTGVAFLRARPWLASCSFDGRVLLWDWRTGERVAEPLAEVGAVHQLATDASGRWLAAACRDGRLRLWDCAVLAADPAATFADCPRRTLANASGSPLWGVAFDGEGARLAGADEQGDVTLWRVEDGRELVTLRSDAVRLRALAFDREGRRLATGTFASRGVVWDLAGVRATLAELGLEPW